jgi:hypothetical protein
MQLKLYLLKRIIHPRDPIWDCNDGFIIRAQTQTMARSIASDAAGDEGPATWLEADCSTCEELNVNGPSAIILRDFHAG